MVRAVIAFEISLKLTSKQLQNVNLCHFPSCDLLSNKGSLSVSLSSVCSIDMTDMTVFASPLIICYGFSMITIICRIRYELRVLKKMNM
jgi:hypothetical protein